LDHLGITAISVSSNGPVVVTGHYYDALPPGCEALASSSGMDDAFVAKLSRTGTCTWAYRYGTPYEDGGSHVQVSSSGDIYWTGVEWANSERAQSFVSKLTAEGKEQWRVRFGDAYVSVTGLAITPRGPAISAVFHDELRVGPAKIAASGSAHDPDGTLVQFTTDGEVAWTTSIGGPGRDGIDSVAVLPDGGLAVTGNLGRMSPCGTSQAATTDLAEPDAFVAWYAEDGRLRACKRLRGSGRFEPDANSLGCAVATDRQGRTFIAGTFRGALTIGPNVLARYEESSTRYGSYPDIFLASYDPSGELRWARRWGSVGIDDINAIAADASGVVLGGRMSRQLGPRGSALAVAYDDAGNIRWSWTFEDARSSWVKDVVTTPCGSTALIMNAESPLERRRDNRSTILWLSPEGREEKYPCRP